MADKRSCNQIDGSTIALTSPIMWVDGVYGDDTRALPYRRDLPYKTLAAAVADAISGDLVYVLPGTYNERNWLKNGVNWHFMLGANVIYSGAVDGAVITDGTDGANGAVTCNITGYAIFRTANSITSAATKATDFLKISNASSVVYVECLEMSSTANGTGVANAALEVANGAVTIKCNLIKSTHDAAILHRGGATSVYGGRIESGKSATEAITISAAGLILNSGVYIAGATGTASIDAVAAQNVRVYGSCVAAVAKGGNITFTVGSALYLVDTDVT